MRCDLCAPWLTWAQLPGANSAHQSALHKHHFRHFECNALFFITIYFRNTREELIEAGATLVAMPEHIGGGDLFILWIDDPAPDTERAQRAVTACAQAKTAQAVRDLAD